MAQRVTAKIVIAQAGNAPPGGYVDGGRDDIVVGSLVTATNADNAGAKGYRWTVTPCAAVSIGDYGLSGVEASTLTLTPPSPDGYGDVGLMLTVYGDPLPDGSPNVATDSVILGVRLATAGYTPGLPIPSEKETSAGGRGTLSIDGGRERRLQETVYGLAKMLIAGGGSATRVRSNANAFLSADVTLAQGTNVTLSQVGQTITINASGGGGSALPSPYTATIPVSGPYTDGLLITGPAGSYPSTDPPPLVLRGRDNTDTTGSQDAGDAIVRGGDLALGNTGGGGGGSATLQGGDGPYPGPARMVGGASPIGGGFCQLIGSDATVADTPGGGITAFGGGALGTGEGGRFDFLGGYSPTGIGGGFNVTCGGCGGGANGAAVSIAAGQSSSGTGGACESFGGASLSGPGGPAGLFGGQGGGSSTGGGCQVSGGPGGATGNGGALTLKGGLSYGGTGKSGGGVTLTGGHATGTTGTGGSVGLAGGDGTLAGGAVDIRGGVGPTPGFVFVAGGAATGSGTGGAGTFAGGAGGSTGSGGDILATGGSSSGGTGQVGGKATVSGGAATGTGGIGGEGRVSGGDGTATGGDVRLTPGLGASSVPGRTRITRGALDVEESSGVVKQRAETCPPITTTSTTAQLAYSYTPGTSEDVTMTVIATADNGTTVGEVIYKGLFRRAVADASGATTIGGDGSVKDKSEAAWKLGHDLTITLNGNAIEVKVKAVAATSTIWAVAVSLVTRTGPV